MSHDRISRDPSILMGKPCIKGTRISVETVVRRLAAGLSAEQIAAEYPELTREDVLAAAAYAADLLRHDGLVAAK
jgi:uncharacterized protein (DUF433 family)